MDHTIFAGLTSGQRKAIQTIIEAEAAGIALTRVLKTSYSCRFCGRVIGKPGEPRNRRKLLLMDHEQNCDHDSAWVFAVNSSTFYGKWMKLDSFVEALEAARSLATAGVMRAAAARLQLATLTASNELVRQITEGDKDGDRRLASVAVLDRADTSTAQKSGFNELPLLLNDLLETAYGSDSDDQPE